MDNENKTPEEVIPQVSDEPELPPAEPEEDEDTD